MAARSCSSRASRSQQLTSSMPLWTNLQMRASKPAASRTSSTELAAFGCTTTTPASGRDIQAIQAEATALFAPFSDDTLYAALERETNRHPIYKDAFAGDIGGMAGLRFQALADRLLCRQSSLEATAERPASARVAEARNEEVSHQGNQRRPPARGRGRCHRCLEYGHYARECTGQLVVRQPRAAPQPDA